MYLVWSLNISVLEMVVQSSPRETTNSTPLKLAACWLAAARESQRGRWYGHIHSCKIFTCLHYYIEMLLVLVNFAFST